MALFLYQILEDNITFCRSMYKNVEGEIRMFAPLEHYGELILKRSDYPEGEVADLWYEANLQIRIIDQLMIKGTDKLYADNMEIVELMEANLNLTSNDAKREEFDKASKSGMQLNIYIKPYFYNVLILQIYGILELALVELCNKKYKKIKYCNQAIEVLRNNNFELDNDLINELDLWRNVRNRLIHRVGKCKSEREAKEFNEKLGLVNEQSQLRIMAQRHNCIQMLETCDKILHNVFRGNIFKEVNW